MSEPRYPYVHIDVPEEAAEDAGTLLWELGAEGVEERDAGTLAKGAGAGRVTLVAAFPTHEAAAEAVAELPAEWHARVEEVVGDAWRDAWKEHYRPFALTPGVVVRPPWEEYAAKPGEQVLVLEPGRAFGTGLHATTTLVARALDAEKHRLVGHHVMDVGTGSGILGLTALLLGAEHAVLTDIDPDAIEVARENAERNELLARVSLHATTDLSAFGQFPVVVANIEARILEPMAQELIDRVLPGGLLVLSGILVGQEDGVRAAYGKLTPVKTDTEGEWVALVFHAPAASPA
jgi:ribosomal protein L11 methyltransferase